jgi:hypothetical protein
MLEDKKIREAHFFYALALNEERKVNDDRDTFEHFLSAFLSASRSVLQYAHNEAVLGGRPGGPIWYETTMSGSSVLQYFKEKRDANIHAQPVSAIREFDLPIEDSIWMGAAPPIPGHVGWPAKVPDKYKFADWPGSEGILTLCMACLRELRGFVQDGQNRGFLTA